MDDKANAGKRRGISAGDVAALLGKDVGPTAGRHESVAEASRRILERREREEKQRRSNRPSLCCVENRLAMGQ